MRFLDSANISIRCILGSSDLLGAWHEKMVWWQLVRETEFLSLHIVSSCRVIVTITQLPLPIMAAQPTRRSHLIHTEVVN